MKKSLIFFIFYLSIISNSYSQKFEKLKQKVTETQFHVDLFYDLTRKIHDSEYSVDDMVVIDTVSLRMLKDGNPIRDFNGIDSLILIDFEYFIDDSLVVKSFVDNASDIVIENKILWFRDSISSHDLPAHLHHPFENYVKSLGVYERRLEKLYKSVNQHNKSFNVPVNLNRYSVAYNHLEITKSFLYAMLELDSIESALSKVDTSVVKVDSLVKTNSHKVDLIDSTTKEISKFLFDTLNKRNIQLITLSALGNKSFGLGYQMIKVNPKSFSYGSDIYLNIDPFEDVFIDFHIGKVYRNFLFQVGPIISVEQKGFDGFDWNWIASVMFLKKGYRFGISYSPMTNWGIKLGIISFN